MYCTIIIYPNIECGFEYDPDKPGTPGQQHREQWAHLPRWSTEGDI